MRIKCARNDVFEMDEVCLQGLAMDTWGPINQDNDIVKIQWIWCRKGLFGRDLAAIRFLARY